MRDLFHKSDRLLALVPMKLQRKIPGNIDWKWRLNAVVGARGTGKTTLLLQRARALKKDNENVLYVTLDDLYFTEHTLLETATRFSQQGGIYLFVDEVHKYPGWAREIKNIYDTLTALIVAFSGSSILEIFRQNVDLSRRALLYELPGLSFREFLFLAEIHEFPSISLSDLLSSHRDIADQILKQIKPLKYFSTYLQSGYYPFFIEAHRDYNLTLEQIINNVVEVDMLYMKGYDPTYSRKLLQLLRVIASSPPFKPNITKLSERIGINRNTLINYLGFLDKAKLISQRHLVEKSISIMQKPDKIFLNNPNLYYTLNPYQVSVGSVRETFFQNQMEVPADIFLHPKYDFTVELNGQKLVFEIGGRNKKRTSPKAMPDLYYVLDDIETGFENTIPLWLFGFLY